VSKGAAVPNIQAKVAKMCPHLRTEFMELASIHDKNLPYAKQSECLITVSKMVTAFRMAPNRSNILQARVEGSQCCRSKGMAQAL